MRKLTTITAFLFSCFALVGTSQAQDTRLIDDFEWASDVDSDNYVEALDDHLWSPRETDVDGEEITTPDITISDDAPEQGGDYSLKMTQDRPDGEDYVIYSVEDLETDSLKDWSRHNYLSFWAKASQDLSAEDDVFKVYTRDGDEGEAYARLPAKDLSTEWQFIVYELPEEDYLIDNLRYPRFYANSEQLSQDELPFSIWIDEVKIHVNDPRGPSMLYDTFEWAQSVQEQDILDSLIEAHAWQPRNRSFNPETEEWIIEPDIGIMGPGTDVAGHNSDYSLRITPNRPDEQDYLLQEFFETDSIYVDWSDYNYVSFWIRSDSTWDSPFKWYMRDIDQGFTEWKPSYLLNEGTPQERELGAVSDEWQLVVLDLNEKSEPFERDALRYTRFHVYTDDTKPDDYNLYIDDVMASAWDPRDPMPQSTAIDDPGGSRAAQKGFVLGKNYPNPFHQRTSISYRLNKSAMVSLEVFDLLGRRVAVLQDDVRRQSGRHDVSWKAAGKSLSSGVYFYRLTAGGEQATEKMIYVR